MWNSGYWNSGYWNSTYWNKSGATGAAAAGASQLLPIMGIGAWLLAALLSGLILLFSYPAQAQIACGPRASLEANAQSNGQTPYATGKMGPLAVMFYVNQKTKSFSVVAFDAEKGCLMAVGKDFDLLNPKHTK